MPKFALGAAALAAALAVTAAAPATARSDTPQNSATATATTRHLNGRLPDGASWIADVPARWNGTLLLFSHGYGPTTAQNAPSPAAGRALLAEGYALAGSSYDPNGPWWALESAERDQLATQEAFADAVGRPARTLSVGQSMGGLVNARLARDAGGRIDGALGLCGLVAGGVDLGNYQLDAEYTIASLLAPDEHLRLVDFADQAAAVATGARLTAAVERAQATPAGRARIALAAAYLNLPDWAPGQKPPAPGDAEEQEAQQYAWFAQGVLSFIVPARYSVEQSAGGNASWNTGVDYAGLLRSSEHADEVESLYRTAGLDLRTDLTALTRGARVHADPQAVRRLERTSTAGQGLAMPLLDLHTTSDQLVPVQQENAFAARVRAAGDGALLRQAYVARQGHCDFTAAEVVAGVHALEHRVATGRWDGGTTPAALQRAAQALGLDGAAFVPYRPTRLVVGRHHS
ncbi:alpha/beta hydrolase [Streptomyces rubradiris]|uniref:Alpha/beta hydrolase n=1 Tax=Streptomyces rubradiris TaxID=285531 RepID=A0ABQ3RB08_STRRR|nr:alpha/beta hydrolase [Streptomyces rubradiris]GHH19086.1 alpha/beta hydrolase [Streptomyces rubradiris]GHI53013.1 alpha/beta hydrolase [Streptomyces rubradiris]